ncbi:MAG: DUF3106 domain-containing protein [bacterium]|jgi:hypothetical protein
MTRSSRHAAGGILPAALGLLLLLQGTVLARGFEAGIPDFPRVNDVPRERLERWRAMPPEERERIRERYRQWKELPPGQRERILERNERWRQLPEEQRNYLRDRREMLKDAGPEERRVVREFFDRMRSLPPTAQRMVRQKIWEWRSLVPREREEAMLSWPFYRGLSVQERRSLRWFLYSRPGDRHVGGDRAPRD